MTASTYIHVSTLQTQLGEKRPSLFRDMLILRKHIIIEERLI